MIKTIVLFTGLLCSLLNAQGTGNLYFLSNAKMPGSDGEGTVDSVHPNDLGMWRQARVFTAFLKSLLEERKP